MTIADTDRGECFRVQISGLRRVVWTTHDRQPGLGIVCCPDLPPLLLFLRVPSAL